VRDGIDRLTLDAVNLQINSVQVAGVAQEFDYDGEQLYIRLGQPTQAATPLEIAIAYQVVQPQRGIYFIAPDEDYPEKPVQVWTQGEDEDSRYWFPCFDYPGQLATSEIRVQIPQPYQAISNGELVEVQEVGNDLSDISARDRIYHWAQKQVHPTYLMTLAVGDFAEFKDEWRGQPVTYYVDKSRADDAIRTMGKTPRMMEFFSKAFGYDYPYPKYAQVCVNDFIFGGMENTSTTLLTDRCLIDERAAIDNRNSESLVAHELAHQWFGDLVVIKHWSHAWIKEGMASYAEILWVTDEYSQDDGIYYRLGEARNYLAEDSSRYRRPIVTHVYREAIELYDRHLYEKGACVYHMIRAELGDELFFKAIHTFVQENAHKTVETIDLLRAIEKASGRNLQFLFDQYVFRGGHPDYKVAYSWDKDSSLAKVTVTQTQVKEGNNGNGGALFDLKVPIGFGLSDSKVQTFPVRIHEREQTFYFPLSEKPKFVSFDVGNHILKTVVLEYPIAELKAQLQHDPDVLSRINAAIALAKKGGLEAVKALSAALVDEPFWGVRVEVAAQLATIRLDQAFEGLLKGLADPEARVRRATVMAIAKLKTPAAYQALKPIAEKGDASYWVEASAISGIGSILGSGETDIDEAIQLFQEVLAQRAGWNEVVRSGAIAGLSQLKTSEAALDLILENTVAGIPQPLRLAAIRALGTISTGQSKPALERILNRLNELARETFFMTQVSVVAALGQMETSKAIGILRAIASQTPDGRVKRSAEEAVQKVQKAAGSDQATKKLQEELDQLKKDNQDLKSRLENLEAKSKKSEG
jgi:aminopeptidase N